MSSTPKNNASVEALEIFILYDSNILYLVYLKKKNIIIKFIRIIFKRIFIIIESPIISEKLVIRL